jgi:hypothetical protein
VPWVHNVRNTDAVVAIDDEQCMSLLRLFNEPEGVAYLEGAGVQRELLDVLPLAGISGIANIVAGAKVAKYYELDERDILFLPMTDSAALYGSRIEELRDEYGPYSRDLAARHHARYVEGTQVDHLKELGYWDRKAIHNLKYFTWVEQQGKSSRELDALWEPDFWAEAFAQVEDWDRLIAEFNRRTGVLEALS